jgi:hypothetical protein
MWLMYYCFCVQQWVFQYLFGRMRHTTTTKKQLIIKTVSGETLYYSQFFSPEVYTQYINKGMANHGHEANQHQFQPAYNLAAECGGNLSEHKFESFFQKKKKRQILVGD